MTALITVEVLTDDELASVARDFLGTPVAFDSAWPPPKGPGAYRWANHGVQYVGSAKDLRDRLGKEQRWVSGYDPETDWSVSVIHGLRVSGATPAWIATSSHEEAIALERHLIEGHRARTGVAPPLVGWDAKEGSLRWIAQEWARRLYGRMWALRGSAIP